MELLAQLFLLLLALGSQQQDIVAVLAAAAMRRLLSSDADVMAETKAGLFVASVDHVAQITISRAMQPSRLNVALWGRL